MIIYMSDILCVTKRSLCKEDFLVRIEKIAKTEAAGIILREKDLSEEEYQALAEKVLAICQRQKMQCILHTYTNVARKLACNAIHLPMPILRTLSKEELGCISDTWSFLSFLRRSSRSRKPWLYLYNGQVISMKPIVRKACQEEA